MEVPTMPRKGEGISVYVSPEIKKKLETIAQEQERSISWIVVKWIEEKIAELEGASNVE